MSENPEGAYGNGTVDRPWYPDIEVRLSGKDGNAFAIMGEVARGLQNGGVPTKEIDRYREESMSGDYDNLLQTAMKWVTVK